MALSYISMRRQLCKGIAIWLLRSHRSFGNVSAAEEARQPPQCQFAARQFPPSPVSWFNTSQQLSTMQLLPPPPSQWGGEEGKKSKTHRLR